MDTMSARRPVSVLTFVVWSLASVALGQVTTSNPVDDMKAVVEAVLDDAGVPFTDQQNRELALVMEEQRQASERLFRDIMDFSGGPVRGADRDRALGRHPVDERGVRGLAHRPVDTGAASSLDRASGGRDPRGGRSTGPAALPGRGGRAARRAADAPDDGHLRDGRGPSAPGRDRRRRRDRRDRHRE